MSTSQSEFVRIRGLRYHVRRWGDRRKPLLLLGHGFLDASATFEDLAQGLLDVCQVAAPDWRGLGYSEWPADGYWFADYVADLDALVQHYADDGAPIWLAGHSMGAQIVSLYAGLQPERVAKLIILDGLFIPEPVPAQAVKQYRRWLTQLRMPMRAKTYASFAALAERIRFQHPQLSEERALFVAHGWGAEDGKGRVRLQSDPRHRLNMPGLYRVEESMAIWREVRAPTLFIDGERSFGLTSITAEERQARRACFGEHQEFVLADVGHMLHFDAPLATAQLMSAFLKS